MYIEQCKKKQDFPVTMSKIICALSIHDGVTEHMHDKGVLNGTRS